MTDRYIDMTNQNEQGFTVLPAGRYISEITGWQEHVKKNNNEVHWIDLRIMDGDFEGETLRYFQTITEQPRSLGFFSRMIRDLALISEEDRTPEGQLGFKLQYGPDLEVDRSDETKVRDVIAVLPNGDEDEARKVIGCQCVAVVEQTTEERKGHPQEGKTIHQVAFLNAYDGSGPETTSGDDRTWI